VGVVLVGLLAWQLLAPRPYFTGSNSVGVASIVANVAPGQELCVGGLNLPAGTGFVRFGLYAERATVRATVRVIAGGRTMVSTVSAPVGGGTRANLDAPIPTTPAAPASVPAIACLAPLEGAVGVGGTAGLQYGQLPATLTAVRVGPASGAGRAAGRGRSSPKASQAAKASSSPKASPAAKAPSAGRSSSAAKAHPAGASPPAAKAPAAVVGSRIAVWFLPPAGHERSLLASAGAIFARAALFRPGIVGAWTYPVLLLGVLPLTWLVSLLLLARATVGRPLTVRGRRLRTGLVIAAVAFLNAASWALITPAFNTPDEPDHFAYVQYLAETGHMPSKIPSAQPAFSIDQTLALNAVNTYSVISNVEARPPWLALDVRRWEQLRAGMSSDPRDNGGGYTPGASGHELPYYALAAAAYELVRSQSAFSQLTAMRLVSALLGAIVAACAYGIVRELLPRRRVAAVAAGLLVAFHPMFGFMAGAVNDDSGVNAAAALSLYLLIRALRRGLSWRIALALGAVLALTPLMKETGYEIYPAVAVGLLGLLWRAWRSGPRRRLDVRPWVALLAGLGAVAGGWRLLKPHVLDTFGMPGGVSAAGGLSPTSSVSLALHMPGRFLVYLWELFLPRLSFMGELFPPGWPFFQVYIERGWASFGWYTFDFPRWVYEIIVLAIGTVGLLALLAAWRYRGAVRCRGWEVLVIAMYPLCVLLAVEAAFFAPAGGRTVVAEQGRYIFPAIAALATIAVGGTFGLGRRWQVSLATALVVAMIGLSYASQLLTLGSFYT
jgi:hypothetical protein